METFLLGLAVVCCAIAAFGLAHHAHDAVRPDKPRRPDIVWRATPEGRAENRRREAEYQRELAEWRAARGR